jgi:hypothetical protein
MPVRVVFDPANAGYHPDARRIQFGPYDVVQVVRNELFVLDDGQSFILATRTLAGDWVVNGLEEMTFRGVRFLAPADQVKHASDPWERPLESDEE